MSRPEPMFSYVYVITSTVPVNGGPLVKVGISDTPHRRLGSIQTACPFPLELAAAVELPGRWYAADLEKLFHEKNADTHVHGEWFAIECDAAIERLRALLCVLLIGSACLEPDHVNDILLASGLRPAFTDEEIAEHKAQVRAAAEGGA